MNKLTFLTSAPLILARLLFLLLLPTTMVFHAGTLPGSREILELGLLGLGGFYFVSRLLDAPPWPRLQTWLVLLALLLVVVGWLAVGYPSSQYEEQFRIFLPTAADSFWPWGAVDGPLAFSSMLRVTGMVGAFLVAWDLAQIRFWRKVLFTTLAWTGVAMAVFGLVQKVAGGVELYWGKAWSNAFGSFWYHGNTGAFLNLCWPLLTGLAFMAFTGHREQKITGQIKRAGGLLGLLILLAGVWVNVSKAGQAIFGVQAMVLLLLGLWYSRRLNWKISRGHWVLTGVLTSLLVLVTVMFGLSHGLDRWENFFERGMTDDRAWMTKTCLSWTDEAGAFGYGPGTFAAVFVVKTTGMLDAPKGYWQFAHNDYAQTILEWGWLGATFWVCLFWGGFIRGMRMLWTPPLESEGSRVLRVSVLISLASVALHAVMDFPLQMFGIQLYTACLMGWAVSKPADSRISPRRKAKHGVA